MIKSEDIYLKSPIFFQKILFNMYAYKISKLKFQKDFYIRLHELKKSQWYTLSDLEALQLEKLKIMIRHCYENVPYYKKLFDEIKLKPSEIRDLENLNRIPILTRDQVKSNLFSLTARNISKKQRLLRNTSGTTGSPMFFFVDKKSYSVNRAYTWRYWNWAEFNFDDKRISLQGRKIIHRERIKPPFWMNNKWDKQLIFSTYHLSEDVMPYFVEKLLKFSPQAIDAYPSAIYVLAKYMDENNIKHKMKAVFTSSETLYPIQREIVERVFQCKIFDKYGLSEMFFVATECEQHKGLHLNMEYVITQVLDKKDEPLSPGKEGRVVCTGLENFSMPLIRYDTGDVSNILPQKCPCRREFPLIDPVTTKAEDQILTPEGKYISGSLLTFPFKPMTNIKKSQIIQEDINTVRVKIVKNGKYCEENSRQLIERMKKCLGKSIEIKLEFVNDICRTENGKYRWVISNVYRKMDFEKDNV
ncbi:hypothetical protein AC481_06970 [miscellaneous Crenarchaeota group archaeon SMTZ-80]|nr:MAG: hypothetical protein AC481_06970 [miscellaneous Crenarchaeota group archaeon SMTZ-80]